MPAAVGRTLQAEGSQSACALLCPWATAARMGLLCPVELLLMAGHRWPCSDTWARANQTSC
eukprot:5331427-Alexandrium_andersonii.AAC.1